MRSWWIVSAVYLVTWVLISPLAVTMLLVNALAALSIQALHMIGFVQRPRPPVSLDFGAGPVLRPFISVHVPAYDEPPELLARTLRALAALDYPNFEVLVLDNNTPSESTWRPIEKLCRGLGPRFRFFHFDGVVGAKAGALNLCLELMHPRADYVAVIDADYQVAPNFLTVAAQHLQSPEISFVQFPQSYRNVSETCAGVEFELSDYFINFARAANSTRSMLLTGTLSVIKVEALRAVDGWSAATITEDAELGARLLRSGRRGLYVHKAVGRGLLPLDLAGLKKQRDRWVAGNMQTLLQVRELFSRGGWRRGALSVAAQLTAWPAFWLLPAITLITGPMLLPYLIWGEPWRELAVHISALTILATALGTALRLTAAATRRGALQGLGQAMAVKLALVWTSSIAWLDGLKQLKFVRTPKVAPSDAGLSISENTIAGLLGAIAALAYAILGFPSAALACTLIAASWPAAALVSRSLKAYAQARQARSAATPLLQSSA